MSKHIIEIPENATTAFITMRLDNGQIHSGVAKGQPHYTESLAMAFGTFVAIVKGIEMMEGPEVSVCKDLREAIKLHSLETSRDMLTGIAAATRAFLDDQEEGGAE